MKRPICGPICFLCSENGKGLSSNTLKVLLSIAALYFTYAYGSVIASIGIFSLGHLREIDPETFLPAFSFVIVFVAFGGGFFFVGFGCCPLKNASPIAFVGR